MQILSFVMWVSVSLRGEKKKKCGATGLVLSLSPPATSQTI